MAKITKQYDHGAGEFTVEGFEKGGLLVHKPTSGYKGWVVTHLASGYKLTPILDSRKQALFVRDAVLGVTDWTVSKADLPIASLGGPVSKAVSASYSAR